MMTCKNHSNTANSNTRDAGGSIVSTPTDRTRQIFEELLEKVKENAKANRKAYYLSVEDAAKTFVGKTYQEFRAYSQRNSFYGWEREKSNLMRDMIAPTEHDTFRGASIIKIRDDNSKRITERINKDIKAMFDSFIEKQTQKVAGIIKERTVKEVTGHVAGDLECYFQFTLDDGSKFDMKTQIVWKVSTRGNQFWQFPTTFHNAYCADGTKISPASEKALKENL